jgi:hypothetical protein
MYLLWIETFKGKEEANCLERMTASIDEISEEDVIEILDIFFLTELMGGAVECEETHEICELSMDISKYFEWWFGL